MPKSDEIVAALADISAIDSHEALKAEMVEWFSDLANYMNRRKDERAALVMRKMAATIDTVPYDMLAEFGHNYDVELIALMMFEHVVAPEVLPDYANAQNLMATILNELRTIDLDHPDTQQAIELTRKVFRDAGRRSG
jgi:hypothetical protein